MQLVQAVKRSKKNERRQRDQELLDSTEIRNPTSPGPLEVEGARLSAPRCCHICQQRYQDLHFFYDRLCPTCGDFNYGKRQQTGELTHRAALVTGGRVKTGYHIALKLLRAGAMVLITTRFAQDAARRYAAEHDFPDWKDRLEIHPIDFRQLSAIEDLTDQLQQELPALDILINNAAQTVRRPPAFYRHLIDPESNGSAPLPPSAQHLVRSGPNQMAKASDAIPAELIPALLTQLAILPGDETYNSEAFPEGELDEDQQQVDRRARNSWDLSPGEVSTWELVEAHAVNCMAPFLLLTRLEPLLLRSPNPDRYVINVSAVEGQFANGYKSGKHPHTNMVKAALNMMTRTCAEAYARQGIYLNSVDTGWHNNEAAHPVAQAMEENGFRPPLDSLDGAARVLDPILQGIAGKDRAYGKFLKNYQETEW